jgi:stearoyl-CoA desaturase (Delta-9 desaturase)
VRHLFRRAKRLLSRESSLLDAHNEEKLQRVLAESQALKVIYEKRLALQQIWGRTSANGHDMLHALRDWCHQAETSGIKALQDFAITLRTYSLQPAPNLAR